MKTIDHRLTRLACVLLGLSALVACEQPECIDGPSNLTPEAVAACMAAPEGTSPELEIVSAGAETLDDGTLVLTWTSWGLQCGTTADEVPLPEDCQTSGWVLTAEIPAALATVGVLELAEHPEIRGTMTVVHESGSGGMRGSHGDEPFFVGTLELTDVSDGCITGVLHGFGTGDPDPTLGGPELDGSFVAPRC